MSKKKLITLSGLFLSFVAAFVCALVFLFSGTGDFGVLKAQASEVSTYAEATHTNHNGWTKLTSSTTTMTGNTNYYLDGDVTINGSITVESGTHTLCLNGHTLTFTNVAFIIHSGASITIDDCNADSSGKLISTTNGSTNIIQNGGTFILNNGQITFNTVGKGIISGTGTTVIINGGTFEVASSCYASMYLDGANVIFNGGVIKNSTLRLRGTTNATFNGGSFACGIEVQSNATGTVNAGASFTSSNYSGVSKFLASGVVLVDSKDGTTYPYKACTQISGQQGSLSGITQKGSATYDAAALAYTDVISVNSGIKNFSQTSTYKVSSGGSSYNGLPTDAGTYTVTFNITGDYYSEFKLYRNALVTYTVTIDKAPVQVSWVANEYTYNGYVQRPAASASTTIGGNQSFDLVYEYEGESIDADNYSVTAKFATEQANYVLANAEHEYVINPRSVTVDWSNTTGFVYNGSEQAPTATVQGVAVDGVLRLEVSGAINAGTHTAEATLDNDNYVISGNTCEFTIEKKTLTKDMINALPNYVYTGTAITPTITFKNNEPIRLSQDYSLAYGANISGTGSVTVTVTSSGNYKLEEGQESIVITFTIATDLSLIDFVIYPQQYTGSALTPTIYVNGVEFAGMSNVQLQWFNNTNASNKAYVVISPALGSGYTQSKTVYFTISPKDITIEWSQEDGYQFTYNGEVQKVTHETINGVSGEIAVTTTYSDEESTNAGTYTVTVTTEDGNYRLVNNTVTYTINPAEAKVTWYNGEQQLSEPTLTLTYNGKVQALTATANGVSADGALDIVVTPNDSKNAGTYTAVATTANGNYVLTNAEYTYTISKMDVTLTWTRQDDTLFDDELVYTYNGEEQHPIAKTYDAAEGETVVFTIKYDAESVNVGTYKAVAVTEDGNYNITNAELEYSIAPATVTLSWDVRTYTYNGTVQKPTATATGVKGEELVIEVNVQEGDAIKANSYTAEAVEVNGNYTFSNGTQAYTIEKKQLTESMIRTLSAQLYTGSAIQPEISFLGGEPISSTDYTLSYGANKEGTGTVEISTTPESNYVISGSESKITLTFAITYNIGDVSFTINAVDYNGNAQEPEIYVEGLEVPYHYLNLTWYNNVNAGVNTAYVVIESSSEGVFRGSQTVYFTINAIEAEVAWDSNTSFVYSGANQAPTATATGANGEVIEVAVAGETNVGSYVATATTSNSNYVLTNAQMSYEITAKEVEVVWAEGALTYNGSTQAPTASIEGVGNDGVITLEVSGAGTNAGNYTATASIANGNYTLVNTSKDYTIMPKSVAVVWGETELKYNGEAQKPTATATDDNGNNVELAISGEQTEEGVYVATATTSNGNYVLTNATVAYSIYKPQEAPSNAGAVAGAAIGCLIGGMAIGAGVGVAIVLKKKRS